MFFYLYQNFFFFLKSGTLLHPSIYQQTGRSSFRDNTDAGPSSTESDVEEDPTFVPRNSLSVLSEDEDSCQTDGEITQSFSEQPSYHELRTPKSKTHSKHVTPTKTSTPRKRRLQSKVCPNFYKLINDNLTIIHVFILN